MTDTNKTRPTDTLRLKIRAWELALSLAWCRTHCTGCANCDKG